MEINRQQLTKEEYIITQPAVELNYYRTQYRTPNDNGWKQGVLKFNKMSLHSERLVNIITGNRMIALGGGLGEKTIIPDHIREEIKQIICMFIDQQLNDDFILNEQRTSREYSAGGVSYNEALNKFNNLYDATFELVRAKWRSSGIDEYFQLLEEQVEKAGLLFSPDSYLKLEDYASGDIYQGANGGYGTALQADTSKWTEEINAGTSTMVSYIDNNGTTKDTLNYIYYLFNQNGYFDAEKKVNGITYEGGVAINFSDNFIVNTNNEIDFNESNLSLEDYYTKNETYSRIEIDAEDEYLQNQINQKAGTTYVNNQLSKKAEKTYVDTLVATKTDQVDFVVLSNDVSNLTDNVSNIEESQDTIINTKVEGIDDGNGNVAINFSPSFYVNGEGQIELDMTLDIPPEYTFADGTVVNTQSTRAENVVSYYDLLLEDRIETIEANPTFTPEEYYTKIETEDRLVEKVDWVAYNSNQDIINNELSEKANQSDLNITNTVLATKADQSDLLILTDEVNDLKEEVVLYESSTPSEQSITLSESFNNFKEIYIKFYKDEEIPYIKITSLLTNLIDLNTDIVIFQDIGGIMGLNNPNDTTLSLQGPNIDLWYFQKVIGVGRRN